MARVELRGLGKVYPNGVAAVSAIDATIEDGEWLVVVGPSGSGKSTLLRLVAGLESPTTGGLSIGGELADGLAPRDRDVAMVFQGPALYPYLTVAENLAFGLRARRLPRSEVAARVEEVARPLGLVDLLGRRPRTLSGGQRQRVALGRALARRARVLLLDEPLSGLDAPLRAALQDALMDWRAKYPTTALHVTHDQAEALAMGDRVAVMDRGRIVQAGSPRDVYERPAHRFVGGFLGSPPMDFWPVAIDRVEGTWQVQGVGPGRGPWIIPEDAPWSAPILGRGPGRVVLGLRPEHLTVSEPGAEIPDPAGATRWDAPMTVRRLEPLGHETIVGLGRDGRDLHARLPADTSLRLGAPVVVRMDPSRVSWFDAETGDAIRSE